MGTWTGHKAVKSLVAAVYAVVIVTVGGLGFFILSTVLTRIAEQEANVFRLIGGTW